MTVELDIGFMAVDDNLTQLDEGSKSSEVPFSVFYEKQYEKMLRLAYLMLGKVELSEDVAQESFLKMHKRWHLIENPDAYIKRVVINACNSHFRKSFREKTALNRMKSIDLESEPTSLDFMHSLNKLNKKQKAAVILKYYFDLSEKEVATVLKLKQGTASSLIHRGVESLRASIERSDNGV